MREQQLALIQKAQESLRASQVLQAEALYDFAASGAYYTMFYIAEVFLLEEALTFSSHSAVISTFGQRFARTGQVPVEFHRWLINAAAKRTRGDYETDVPVSDEESLEIIERSQIFIEAAKQRLEGNENTDLGD